MSRTKYTYDDCALLKRVENPLNKITTYSWDLVNQLRSVTNPLGNRTTWTYDDNGRLTQLTNPLGDSTTNRYDAEGNLIAVINPLGERTSYAYDAARNQIRVTDALNQSTTSIYDAANQLLATVSPEDPSKERTTFTYDAVGNQIAVTNALGNITTTAYDQENRLRNQMDALGRRTWFGYDRVGRTVTQMPPHGDGIVTGLGLEKNFIGVSPEVRLFSVSWDKSSSELSEYLAYSAAFKGGVRVATGDVTGDGLDEVVTGAGPFGGPHVIVWRISNTGAPSYLASFLAYSINFRGGVHVGAGDVDCDGKAEVITGAGKGGGPHVIVWRISETGQQSILSSFFAYGQGFRGGVRVAAGDVDGDGFAELITGAGPGGGPHVKIFRISPTGQRTLFASFFAYDTAFRGGVFVAAGDVDGDGKDEVITGADAGGGPHVRVWDISADGVPTIKAGFFPYAVSYGGGVRVGAADVDCDGLAEVLTGPGEDHDPQLKAYDIASGSATQIMDFLAYDSSFQDGVYPAGGLLARPINRTRYDDLGNTLAAIDPLDHRTSYAYDDAGRAIRATNPLGKHATTVYVGAGDEVATIDPLGFRTTQTFDDAGRLLRTTNPLGAITTNVYDDAGQTVGVIDRVAARRTTFAYDAAGQNIRVTNPEGNHTTTVYDDAGQQRSVIDRLATNRVTFAYDQAGRQVRLTNPLGKHTTTVYDADGRNVVSINPLAKRTTLTYDAAGQLVRTTDPLSLHTTNVYDAAGQTRATVNPLGFRTSSTYDCDGQRVMLEDAEGRPTTSTYDFAGRLVDIDLLGLRTTYAYDAADQQVAFVDANANRTTHIYDDDGRQVAVRNALDQRTTVGYDGAGQRTLRIDARGNRTTYSYDAGGRLLGQRYPDATRVTYTYRADGLRTVLNDWTGRTSYTWDAAGRLLDVTDPAGKVVEYDYDAAGQRTVMVDPDSGRFTYTHDDAGQLTSLANPQNGDFQWSYDDAGRVEANQVMKYKVSYTYDDADRITRQFSYNRIDSVTVTDFSYSYDQVNKPQWVEDADGERTTYSYGNAYRLTREQRVGTTVTYDTTYVWDFVGNRKRKVAGAARTTYTYNAGNQLVTLEESGGTTTFSYDGDGNQTLKLQAGGNRTTYTWDYENRLTRVQVPAGTLSTFTYNGDGKRVEKQASATTVKHVWDGQRILLETDGADATQVVYTQEPAGFGNVLSQRISDPDSTYHFDALGSTAKLAAEGDVADVTDTYYYDGFGNILASTGSTGAPFKFVGRLGYYYDEQTGLYWVRARYYDPETGRFASPDPLGDEAGTNRYVYVDGQPTLLVDPSGFQTSIGPMPGHGAADRRLPPEFRPPPTDVAGIMGEIARGEDYLPPQLRPRPNPPISRPQVPFGGPTGTRRCLFGFIGDNQSETDQLCQATRLLSMPSDCRECCVCDLAIIPKIMRRCKCCDLILHGHRGGPVNSGGIVSKCGSTGMCRVLPDRKFEIMLGKFFKGNGCGRCRIIIKACGSASYMGPLRRLARSTGCIVCGSAFEHCPLPKPVGPIRITGSPFICVDESGGLMNTAPPFTDYLERDPTSFFPVTKVEPWPGVRPGFDPSEQSWTIPPCPNTFRGT